jgi:glycosyltransferase involved in cell wall biosynthesis
VDSDPRLPLVSIVTPSFNQAAFLERAIASVLGQDYPNLEYIVLDGGSSDQSVEIIRRYEDRLAWWDSRPDEGQVDALLKGFERARGEILGWLNSDDELLPGAITAVVEELGADPGVMLVYGDNTLVDENTGNEAILRAGPFDVAEMLRTGQNPVPQPGSLFRREALELAGGLARDGYYYFDFEFVARLGLVARVSRLPARLGLYRLHDESKSIAARETKADDHLRMYDAVFGLPDLPQAVRQIESEARATAYRVAGEYYYAAGERRRARSALVRSLRFHPRLRTLALLARVVLPESLIALLRRLRRALR